VIAGDMMRQALFLRGIYASDVAAGGADILQQMQSQGNLYACVAIAGGADVVR
jgi:hypothetical protein